MDPLSITSGIVGFLSLGIQVTQALFGFYDVCKNKDAEIAKITQNIQNLQSIFQSLETAVYQRQSQADAEELLSVVNKITQKCQETIEELHMEYQKFNPKSETCPKSRAKDFGRRVAYAFRKSTVQRIEEDLDHIHETLLLAVNLLQLEGYHHIENGISDVKALLERTNAIQLPATIRAWLRAPDPSASHSATYAKRHPSTGEWLITSKQFLNWLLMQNSFLWINGFAGCGKSVLCSIIIHILVLQLSAQFSDGQKELEHLYTSSNSSTLPVEVLLQPLRKFLVHFQDTYVILDAIDECPDGVGREGILRAIKLIRKWSFPGVHLLVTSRDQLSIRRSLNPTSGCDISMKNSGIDKDIYNFVHHEINSDTKLQRWKARHDEIKNKIITGAQGVFRYVECQLNSLRRARNRNQLDQYLHTLPRDLDETYDSILCNIDEIYMADVRRILTVLCLSNRPLTIEELIDAHAIELERGEIPYFDREGRSYEQDDIVDICLGLVEVNRVEDDSGHITSKARLAHFSVQEYLQSDRIRQQKSKGFAIVDELANTEMSQICLAYLLNPALSKGDLDEKKLQMFPLAQLAAMSWSHYYEKSQKGNHKSQRLLFDLFQDRTSSFVTWVKIHDVDRPWYSEVSLERHTDDIPSPFYYAALLGLEYALINMLVIASKTENISNFVNAQGGNYGNPLQAASFEGHREIVKMLLAHDADVNFHGGYYGCALQAASLRGHQEVVQILLGRGADVNARCGYYSSALQAASVEGHQKIAQILLDRGADVNARGGYYCNALQAASFKGQQDIVRMLLDYGADVNAQGGGYNNALQAASLRGHDEVVQILLNRSSDVGLQIGGISNALRVASAEGHQKVVEILIDRAANVNAQGGYYGNALQAASAEGHQEIAQILIERGAHVNAQGGFYGNALQAASAEGHQKIVRILLDRNADERAQGGYYGSALQAALFQGHAEVAQMMFNHDLSI